MMVRISIVKQKNYYRDPHRGSTTEQYSRRNFLGKVGGAAPAVLLHRCGFRERAPGRSKHGDAPNILLITVDDMHWQSPNCFGGRTSEATPRIDRLAEEGRRFLHAHVTLAVCTPSRAALLTGCYPQRSGVEGFQQIRPEVPTLPAVLKENGYLCAAIGKHLGQREVLHWDREADPILNKGWRSPPAYRAFVTDFLDQARSQGRQFFLMANVHDPHRPYYGTSSDTRLAASTEYPWTPPSRIYQPEEVERPGFLPELPDIRLELAQYYSSVRRSDDTVGAVLDALGESGLEGETLVMFLSDNGMSFPFAKTNCYLHSTRTPWIVRWPGVVEPGGLDTHHFISGIDFMPTVLEAAGIEPISRIDGSSFLPLLAGQEQEGRDLVFTQFNHIHGRRPYPMRSVQNARFAYIFNPWSNGSRKYSAEPLSGLSYPSMRQAAETNEEIAERVRMLEYRTVEEFYDLEGDPDSLHNLIQDPNVTVEIDALRNHLSAWMKEHRDPALPALESRDSPEALEKFMTEYGARAAHQIRERTSYEEKSGYKF